MPTGVVRLRLSSDVIKKLFRARGIAVSKGIEEVLGKYCEEV
jgi:uncharacterized protein (DUF4415 family)